MKLITNSKIFSFIVLLQIFLFILIILQNSSYAKEKRFWNNKKCAVVLTYDDALNTHLDNVIPLLDSLNFRATFYISGISQGFKNRIQDWALAAKKGNELGNHTLFHPCAGNIKGREWVKPEYDLNKYTLQRITDEIEMTNVLLEAIDGKKKRTFAYTCGDMKVGDSSFVDIVKNYFVAARGVEGKIENIDEIDLSNIGCYVVNGQSADDLIELVNKAMNNEALIVFLFHGVGGEHSINVSLEAHCKLLHYLKQNEKNIWVAPLIDVAEYIKEYNKSVKTDE